MSRRSTAPVFAALGDETRLELVSRLCASGPLSTMALAAGTSVTRQGITKHLDVLAAAGIVRDTRHGRERIWEIELARLDVARRFLDQVSQRWDEAIDRLKQLVED